VKAAGKWYKFAGLLHVPHTHIHRAVLKSKFPPHNEQRAVGGALLVKCMSLMALKGYLFNVRAVVTLNITVSSMLSSCILL